MEINFRKPNSIFKLKGSDPSKPSNGNSKSPKENTKPSNDNSKGSNNNSKGSNDNSKPENNKPNPNQEPNNGNFGPQKPRPNAQRTGTSQTTPTIKQKKKSSPLKIMMWVLLTFLLISMVMNIFFNIPTYVLKDFELFIIDISDGDVNIGNDVYTIQEISADATPYSEEYDRIVLTLETSGGTLKFIEYVRAGSTTIFHEPIMIDGFEFFSDTIGPNGGYWEGGFRELTQELNAMFTQMQKSGFIQSYEGMTSAVPAQPSFFFQMLFTWGPWLFFFVLAWVIIKKMVDKQQGDMSISKSKAQLQVSNLTFNDVAGYEELKIELKEMVDYLKMPEKFAAVGAKTPKGILMVGPPGTGKTLFAKAVAGEANVPFFTVSGSDFVEMFIGVGASRVRNMFKVAKETGKCLIFIDEIDAVGRSRGTGVGGGNDEREQTLNQLLVEMDGFNENSGIIVMAATNRADVLDPALIRPGRFDRQVSLRLPDVKEREMILRVHKGTKKFSSKISLEEIAKRTPGFSGAQLENVLNEAAILAVREEQDIITTDLIDEAIDRAVGGGPAKKTKIVSQEEKKVIAYHEAGHAIIGLKLEHAQLVQKITIIPRGDAGGYVLMTPKKEKMIQTKNELMATIVSYLGGRASEETFFGMDNVTTGASADIQSATSIARSMVTKFGMSKLGPVLLENSSADPFLGRELSMGKTISSKTMHEIDIEISNIIERSLKLALETIKKHKKLLIQIADYLIENEVITSEEIRYIEKNNKVPPKDFFSATKEEKAQAKREALAKRQAEEKRLEELRNPKPANAPIEKEKELKTATKSKPKKDKKDVIDVSNKPKKSEDKKS